MRRVPHLVLAAAADLRVCLVLHCTHRSASMIGVGNGRLALDVLAAALGDQLVLKPTTYAPRRRLTLAFEVALNQVVFLTMLRVMTHL